MFDDKDGDIESVADVVNRRHQIERLAIVQSRGRLVEQEQFRTCGQCARDLEPALIAVRKILRVVAGTRFESENLQQVRRFLLGDFLGVIERVRVQHRRRAGVFVVDMPADLDVVEHRQLFEKTNVLERARHAERRDLVRLEVVRGNAANVDLPFGRLVDAGEHVEHGRLPGTVRTDQTDQLVRLNGQIEVRHRRQAAEADRYVVRIKQSVPVSHQDTGAEPSSVLFGAVSLRRRSTCHNSRRPSSPCGRVSISTISMIE